MIKDTLLHKTCQAFISLFQLLSNPDFSTAICVIWFVIVLIAIFYLLLGDNN